MTPEQRAMLQRRLDDAEEQYHLLMTGQSARVFVDQNGERVEYATANAARLQSYIDDLKRQLGVGTTVLGPMTTWL